MKFPDIPSNEEHRLAALHSLLVLDTPPESRFDNITAYAALRFQVDIVLISLVDRDRQWFKSSYGLETRETSRDVSFCAHALHADALFEVCDARIDDRFRDNPLVTGAPHICYYAGYPIALDDDQRIGTLCLIDRRPHRLNAEERNELRDLTALVRAELQKRRSDIARDFTSLAACTSAICAGQRQPALSGRR